MIGNKRVRAFLSDQIKLTDIIDYFGKELSIIGNVYYKPSQEVKSIEIISSESPDKNQTYFHSIPSPIKDEIDVKGLVKKQGFQGTNFNNLLGNWPGNEDVQEIIESCK